MIIQSCRDWLSLWLNSRKVDWRMLPLLGVLNSLSLIDRSNLGLARAAGMDHTLVGLQAQLRSSVTAKTRSLTKWALQHLSKGARYSIVSCIFFVPYIILYVKSLSQKKIGRSNISWSPPTTYSQLPSNLFLRKIGAVHYLAALVVSWGAVQLAMGFVPSWGYLAFCRTLLGTFEVCFLFYPTLGSI